MYGASTTPKGRLIFTWPGQVLNVVDADTVRVHVDQGLDRCAKLRVRLRGIDCPEDETVEGRAAEMVVEGLCPAGSPVTVISYEKRSFERVVGDVILADGRDLAAELIARGLAVRSPKG